VTAGDAFSVIGRIRAHAHTVDRNKPVTLRHGQRASAHATTEISAKTEAFIPMKRLGGRCERGLRRCLWVNGTATTAQILEWAFAR
jgi:hypothetical protein